MFLASKSLLYSLLSVASNRSLNLNDPKISVVLLFIDFLESVLKTAVVFHYNRILGTEIKRITTLQSVLERIEGKIANIFISIVHDLGYASTSNRKSLPL
jgi:hypothetical protein